VAVDFERYLTEIEPDNICGEDLEYDAEFIALEQEVQGKEEQIMGDSIKDAVPPNWQKVIKQAEKLLGRTYDFRILIHYIRALAETQGLVGLADGIHLLKLCTEKNWKDLHPQLDPDDDNDPTERMNILMTLCDFETFLKPLQKVPLIESKGLGQFNLTEIQIAKGHIAFVSENDDDEAPQLATVEAVFQSCDAEELKATAKAASEIVIDLQQLEAFITEQVGVNEAISFSKLSALLTEIKVVLSEYVEKRGLVDSVEESGDDSSEELGVGEESQETIVKKTKPQGINNNQDVLNALNLICEYYKKNEPSSPIPILIDRIVRLVGKSFIEILQDMAPNGVEQVEFLRGSSKNEE